MPAIVGNLTVDGARLWDALMEMAEIGPGLRGDSKVPVELEGMRPLALQAVPDQQPLVPGPSDSTNMPNATILVAVVGCQ